MHPQRISLALFPDVVMHMGESAAKRHPRFAAAKGGDVEAARLMVSELVRDEGIGRVVALLGGRAVRFLPVHALEFAGVNEIPAALARFLSRELGQALDDSIVQSNSVAHTGASGYHRLANQALFEGPVTAGATYVVVDDFVGQGGTLANMIGYVASQGGVVAGATVLTGRPDSAKLAPDAEILLALRNKHGPDLEKWWLESFGFGFDQLTWSEARYLEKSSDAHTIRDRLAAARFESGA